MCKSIPYVYGKTKDRSLINVIEQSRGENDNGSMEEWWMCGECFCTQFDNGYYHAYIIEKSALYGVILRDYRISREGKMVYTDRYYSVPTKEDLIKWCTDREINIT